MNATMRQRLADAARRAGLHVRYAGPRLRVASVWADDQCLRLIKRFDSGAAALHWLKQQARPAGE
jgi:hypothetical protein